MFIQDYNYLLLIVAGKDNSESDEEDFTKTSEISTSNLLSTNLSSSKPTPSKVKRQAPVNNYIIRQLSDKDNQHFENLILRMIVSNGLPFTFMENQETQDVFNFIMPTLKLPNRRAISDQILSKASTTLTENISQRVRADKIGVTAAFDGWTNIKQEHLFGVVLITSQGEALIWNASDVSNQRSRTEDVKLLIKTVMDNAKIEA